MTTAIKSQRLRLMLDHYLTVRGGKRMPSRSEIDAVELGPVLPIIWISQYERKAETFRYRLAGEDVNEIWGMSVAGRLLSDFVPPERFEVVNEAFLRVVREEAALIASGPIYRCTDRIAIGERLVLPLSSDGVTADGLLGASERELLVDFDKANMQQQVSSYVSVDELADLPLDRAVGD